MNSIRKHASRLADCFIQRQKLDNGIYGKGFADFVSLYGGVPELYTVDSKNAIDIVCLEQFLEANHDYKYATVVHCDTPSGMLNPIQDICPLLKRYGIMTVVDSVSGMFGEEVCVDDWGIDILCGGSQKAVSAPPGLTFVVVSEDAKQAMHNRKVPIAAFYANLAVFEGYYEKKWFPYTMPISDIYGLREAFNNIEKDNDMLKRHAIIGEATREAVRKAGLKLYLESGFSNTVTVFTVPEGIEASQILKAMREKYRIMLAGSFGELEGKVIRIGHMGANATFDNMIETLRGLTNVLEELGVPLQARLDEVFHAECMRFLSKHGEVRC